MKRVAIIEDTTLKIKLDIGIEMDYFIQKGQEFELIGEFKNVNNGSELIAIRHEEDHFIFAIEKSKVSH